MIHLLTRYYRPSWQGGDTQQPLCRKPAIGFGGDDGADLEMTADRAAVSCPFCLHALSLNRTSSAGYAVFNAEAFEAPRRRRNDDLKHCRAIWKASKGRMFPFVVIVMQQARAA